MRKLLITVTLLSAVVIGAIAQDMAVATVRFKRTEPVSGRQLNDTISALEQQQGRELTAQERKTVLDQMIDQILIVQAAEADRTVSVSDAEIEQAGMRLISQQLTAVGAIPPGAVITDKVQYKQLVEQQGITLQEFETTIRKQILVEKYITSSKQVEFQGIGSATSAEIDAEYQRRVSEFVVSDSVFFNQIFFDTRSATPAEDAQKRSKAQEVYRRLMNTAATFADLVVAESEDEVSKARGGLIGPLMKGDMIADQLYGSDFVNKVFEMNVDDVSGVMKSNVGYHIIQITEKKAAQLLPKDDPEVRNYLEQIIYAGKYQRKFDEVAQALVLDLRSQSTINYFGEYR